MYFLTIYLPTLPKKYLDKRKEIKKEEEKKNDQLKRVNDIDEGYKKLR